MKKIFCLLILLFILFSLMGCKKKNSWSIVYEVKGTSNDYNVTYANYQSNTEQRSSVSSGWTYSFSTGITYQFLYISAQNNKGSGDVRVNIYIDGNLYATAYSSGAYVVATASGSTPSSLE